MAESKLTIWNRLEPARVRAAWTAIVALAVALGFAIPSEADTLVTAIIGVLAVVIPLIQGEITRKAVTPNARAQAMAGAPLTSEDIATSEALGSLDREEGNA
jgi:hypothetical protein